ncbi:MAG: peptide deformylase, partial [Chloroflexi bacterium]|nr:peptide deformylase [Chloroflexota bacterium]
MPIRKVLLYPQDEALLRRKSIPLPKVDKQVRTLIRDLEDTLLRLGGAGLAAPQIGVHARVVVVRFGQNEGAMHPPTALINPTIISRST